jgi:hypothetical protein
MSFAQQVKAEIEHLSPIFAAADESDREFHQAWKLGVAKLGVSRYKQTETYNGTLDRWHAATRAIDRIVATAFAQTRLGDLSQLPILFAYIAMPGRYYRSGYQRADIWRLLKRLTLDEEKSGILYRIILHQVESAGPEFREMSRFAAHIDSSELRENIRSVGLRSEKEYVRKRVNRLLARLDQIRDDAGPKG